MQIEWSLPRQAFVAKATLKAFNVSIAPGAPGLDVDRLNLVRP